MRIPKPGTVREHLRARVQTPAIPRGLVTQILQPVGLGNPTVIRNVAHGWRTNLVVVTSGERRLVVRRYPDRWSDSAIEQEHSLLNQLEVRDYPAPRLVELGRGSFLHVIDGVRYSVQSFEPGATLTGYYLRRSEISRLQRLIGSVLAEFHRALGGFVPSGSHHLGVDPETGRQRRSREWHLDAIDRMIRDGARSILGDANEINSLRRRLTHLDRMVEDARLPQAIIHGDYGLHNIIFRRSGGAVVHDYELSRPDIRVLDVAASLSRVRPEFRSHFLDGVLDGHGIDDSELDMLETVWEWYRIRGAIQSAEAYTRLGGQHRRNAVAKRLVEASELRSGREMVPS